MLGTRFRLTSTLRCCSGVIHRDCGDAVSKKCNNCDVLKDGVQIGKVEENLKVVTDFTIIFLSRSKQPKSTYV